MTIETLSVRGTPADIGAGHGRRYATDIGRFAAERLALAGDALWVGRNVSKNDVLGLAQECLAEHAAYAPSLTRELEAMADAARLSPAEMLIVSGFTDFMDTAYAAFGGATPAPAAADNCTAVMVPGVRSATGNALFAQTWDMHETATEHVILLRGEPDDAPAFTVFTSRGCLGMIGMNAAGITIGINNLSGADGRVGVTWNFVIREVLAQTDFDQARHALDRAELAGAHNYLLTGPDGRGLNVEATATNRVTTELADTPLVHTNHCLHESTRAHERERLPASQQSSEARLARVTELLADNSRIAIDDLAELTRDTRAICYPPTPKLGMTTCGAVLADPANRRLWALRGLPSEQRYEAFDVG